MVCCGWWRGRVGSVPSLIESAIDASYYVLGVQTAVAPAEARGLASPWLPLITPSYSKRNIQECSLI